MKHGMCTKLVGWGLPCYFFRCCILIISWYLFGRDCFLFSEGYVTLKCLVCPYAFLFWLRLLIFFAVRESLRVFCNAKISRLQACKTVESAHHPCNLGMCLSFWSVQSAHRMARCSWQHSCIGVKFSKLSVWVSVWVLTLQTRLP